MHKQIKFVMLILTMTVLSSCSGKNEPLDFSDNTRHENYLLPYSYLSPTGWKLYDAVEMETSRFKFIEKLKQNRFNRVTEIDSIEIFVAMMKNGYKYKDMILPYNLFHLAPREMLGFYTSKIFTFSKENAKAAVKELFLMSYENIECTVTEHKLKERDVIYASCNAILNYDETLRMTKETVWVRTSPETDKKFCAKRIGCESCKPKLAEGDECLPFFNIDCIFYTKAEEKSQASCLDFVRHMEFKE